MKFEQAYKIVASWWKKIVKFTNYSFWYKDFWIIWYIWIWKEKNQIYFVNATFDKKSISFLEKINYKNLFIENWTLQGYDEFISNVKFKIKWFDLEKHWFEKDTNEIFIDTELQILNEKNILYSTSLYNKIEPEFYKDIKLLDENLNVDNWFINQRHFANFMYDMNLIFDSWHYTLKRERQNDLKSIFEMMLNYNSSCFDLKWDFINYMKVLIGAWFLYIDLNNSNYTQKQTDLLKSILPENTTYIFYYSLEKNNNDDESKKWILVFWNESVINFYNFNIETLLYPPYYKDKISKCFSYDFIHLLEPFYLNKNLNIFLEWLISRLKKNNFKINMFEIWIITKYFYWKEKEEIDIEKNKTTKLMLIPISWSSPRRNWSFDLVLKTNKCEMSYMNFHIFDLYPSTYEQLINFVSILSWKNKWDYIVKNKQNLYSQIHSELIVLYNKKDTIPIPFTKQWQNNIFEINNNITITFVEDDSNKAINSIYIYKLNDNKVLDTFTFHDVSIYSKEDIFDVVNMFKQ